MPPLANNAHAMRAILFASAIATTLNGRRARGCCLDLCGCGRVGYRDLVILCRPSALSGALRWPSMSCSRLRIGASGAGPYGVGTVG
jgi:hypothetical protein